MLYHGRRTHGLFLLFSNNPQLQQLPNSSACWTNLRQLYLNSLPLLRSLPSAAAQWRALKVLHVNDAALEELPAEVEHLTSLVMVIYSRGPFLPVSVSYLKMIIYVSHTYSRASLTLTSLSFSRNDLTLSNQSLANNLSLSPLFACLLNDVSRTTSLSRKGSLSWMIDIHAISKWHL